MDDPLAWLIGTGLIFLIFGILGVMTLRQRRRAAPAMPGAAMPSPEALADLGLLPGAQRAALARRRRSEARLTAEGVPINRHLPMLDPDTTPRAREEVAERAMALLLVAVHAEGMPGGQAVELLRRYGVGHAVTEPERAFLADDQPDAAAKARFGWRYEAAWVLLWALGFVAGLDRPDHPIDAAVASRVLAGRTREAFLAAAALRPLDALLDEADLIYRYHWAVRDAALNGRPAPAGLSGDVVMERHHALNWLIGLGRTWEDVPLDT